MRLVILNFQSDILVAANNNYADLGIQLGITHLGLSISLWYQININLNLGNIHSL